MKKNNLFIFQYYNHEEVDRDKVLSYIEQQKIIGISKNKAIKELIKKGLENENDLN